MQLRPPINQTAIGLYLPCLNGHGSFCDKPSTIVTATVDELCTVLTGVLLLLLQAVMVEKNKPSDIPGGMGAGGMPSGMTI